jgi:quinol monooxygenase YgiN
MIRRVAFFCLVAAVGVVPLFARQAQTPAPAGDQAYLVAYVDIMPSARQTMIAAIATYRDASAREGRDGRVEAFEQVGRVAHFVILEHWRDQAAIEAHRMAPHTTQFREALQGIRVSGYDERPYKTLSVAPASAAPGGRPVYVVSHVDIAGAGAMAEAPGLLRRQAEDSRREAGSIRFDVLQHSMRANHFTVVEGWRDQAALDAHAAAAHSRAYRDAVQPISGSPVDERVYTAVQ